MVVSVTQAFLLYAFIRQNKCMKHETYIYMYVCVRERERVLLLSLTHGELKVDQIFGVSLNRDQYQR